MVTSLETGRSCRLRRLVLLASVLIVTLLSGCAYGNRIKQEGAPASGEYIALVQSAVEQYQVKTGVLPLQFREDAHSGYEKYMVDFKKLMDAHLMTTVPVNAFENGGTAVYMLVRIETKPEVRLLDLVTYQQANELQHEVDAFKAANGGMLPIGPELAPGYWTVDYNKLNRKQAQARSPYSRVMLNFVIQQTGKVGIDYAPEIMKIIQKKAYKPDSKEDLRELLLNEGFFIPARSFPYRWSGDTPVLVISY